MIIGEYIYIYVHLLKQYVHSFIWFIYIYIHFIHIYMFICTHLHLHSSKIAMPTSRSIGLSVFSRLDSNCVNPAEPTSHAWCPEVSVISSRDLRWNFDGERTGSGLGYLGDEIVPRYRGIIVNHYTPEILHSPWKIHHFDGIYQERWWFSWAVGICREGIYIQENLQQDPLVRLSFFMKTVLGWKITIFCVD